MSFTKPCWPCIIATALALLALLLWTPLASPVSKHAVSQRLEAPVRAALAVRPGLEAVDVRMQGQRAILVGAVATEEDRDAAVTVVRGALGAGGFISGPVMMVDASALDVRPTSGRYVWSATRDAQRVTLSGAVPGRAAREALLASARAAMPPPLEVVDAMQLAPGAPGGDWVGTARAGLTALASLSSGEVTLSDRILTVAGDGPMITVRELDARMQAGAVPAPFETRLRLRADGETFVPELGGVDLFSGPPAADDCQDAFDAVMQRNVINFASGRAEIDEESIATLDKLAVVARRCTGFAILVEGHTDSEGELQRNIRLSERRAEAVVQHLAGAGVPTERMSTRGFGPTRPVASNDDETGRAANRRIEFTVTR